MSLNERPVVGADHYSPVSPQRRTNWFYPGDSRAFREQTISLFAPRVIAT